MEAVEAVVSVYFKIMERVTYDTEVRCPPPFISGQSQCKLCLRYFQQGEELMKIPICDHIFHIPCLRKWLVDWQKCPTCEQNIIKLPEPQKQRYLRQMEEIRGHSYPDQHSPREHN